MMGAAKILLSCSIFFLISCAAPERKVDPSSSIKNKTLLILSLSKGEKLLGESRKNLLEKSGFEAERVSWESDGYLKKIFKDLLKEKFNKIEYLNIASEIKISSSIKDIILSSSKISQQEPDYYLILVPEVAGINNSTSSWSSKCHNPFCLPVIAVYLVADAFYKLVNKSVSFFIDERNIKPLKNEYEFVFKLDSRSYKNGYDTRCFSGFDLMLIRKGEEKFSAYAKMNYDQFVELGADYKNFSSFDNFSSEEKKLIKDACLKSISNGIGRGLYNMGIL